MVVRSFRNSSHFIHQRTVSLWKASPSSLSSSKKDWGLEFCLICSDLSFNSSPDSGVYLWTYADYPLLKSIVCLSPFVAFGNNGSLRLFPLPPGIL